VILSYRAISVNPKFERNVQIAEAREDDESWVTLLVGENGTRKSYLLSLIFGDVTRISIGRRANARIRACMTTNEVSQVIALSGTPLDRFPRHVKIRRHPEFGWNIPYTYIGQRAANGVVGTGQSDKRLVSALLENRSELMAREGELKMVFGQLRLAVVAKVRFNVPYKRLASTDINEHIETNVGKLEEFCRGLIKTALRNTPDYKDAVEALKFIDSPAKRSVLARHLMNFPKDGYHVRIALTGTFSRRGTFPTSVWRMLFESSAVELSHIEFEAQGGDTNLWGGTAIQGNFLSSGQWSWLSTLGGLATQITDDSLVLVDEPENSLHPSWQRSYVPTLLKILRNHKRCHAIIATHAPLIASGLPPDAGNVRRMHREIVRGKPVICSSAADSTFGWSASDAYENLFELDTTRAKIFDHEATEALEMIRDQSGSRHRQAELLEILTAHQKSLPEFDSMRHVLSGIIADLTAIHGAQK